MPSKRGFAAVGAFLIFGSLMATLAGTTLACPGTAVDRIWDLNPRAYRELAPYGRMVGIPFLLLGATMAVTVVGWFKRRQWGWRLAVGIIATQILGDIANIISGRMVEGLIGATLAGALLTYLFAAPIRTGFQKRSR